jgi:hypothetical protein
VADFMMKAALNQQDSSGAYRDFLSDDLELARKNCLKMRIQSVGYRDPAVQQITVPEIDPGVPGLPSLPTKPKLKLSQPRVILLRMREFAVSFSPADEPFAIAGDGLYVRASDAVTPIEVVVRVNGGNRTWTWPGELAFDVGIGWFRFPFAQVSPAAGDVIKIESIQTPDYTVTGTGRPWQYVTVQN